MRHDFCSQYVNYLPVYISNCSHIITENSSPDLVNKVNAEFQPVDLPELLVITGRACARILSGYQKSKTEESSILDKLREEGLLAKPKGKTAGGMSFEVVDSTVAAAAAETRPKTAAAATASEDIFVSAAFMPQKVRAKLENRRGVSSPILLLLHLPNRETV